MLQELPSELANILKPLFNTDNLEKLFKKQVGYYQDVLEAYINLVLDKHPNINKFHLCNYNKKIQINEADVNETINNYLGNLELNINAKLKVSSITNNKEEITYKRIEKNYDVIIKPAYYFVNDYIIEQDKTIIPFLDNREILIALYEAYSNRKKLTFIYTIDKKNCIDELIQEIQLKPLEEIILKTKINKKNKKTKKKKTKKNKNINSLNNENINVSSDSDETYDKTDNENINDSSDDGNINDSSDDGNINDSSDDGNINDNSDDGNIYDSSNDGNINNSLDSDENININDRVIFNYNVVNTEIILNMLDKLVNSNETFKNNFSSFKLYIKKGIHYDSYKREHFTAYFFNDIMTQSTYHFYIKNKNIISITTISNIL